MTTTRITTTPRIAAPSSGSAEEAATMTSASASAPTTATGRVAPAVADDVDGTRSSSGARRRSVALALLVSAQFVVMLDTSIVNVALPSIQNDLGLTAAGLTWVVNAYVLVFGGLLLLSGRLADLLGRRRMFVAGSAVFTAGTLVAATASNEQLLVAGRIVQGIGAATLSPAAMSLLLLTFPGQARARAMSLWGAASAVGGATGVLTGGVLAGTLGWSSVFLVTVPASIVAVILAPHVLPAGQGGARRRVDVRGAVAVTGAVVALVHGAVSAGDHGWLSFPVVASFVASLVLLTVFIAIEGRVADPLVPLELFRARELTTGVGLAVLGGAARASSYVLIALFLQQALTMPPERAGLAMVPTSLMGLAVSLTLLPRIVNAMGPERSLVVGLVILAVGQLWLGHTPLGSGYLSGVLPALLLVATGVALSFTPTTMIMAAAVPDTHAGLASGLAGSGTQVGAALGTATFISIGISASGTADHVLGSPGFAAAFTAAAVVSFGTAVLALALARGRR
jgi:EmrB/QacA subfamily drug resistance transporter